MDSTKEPACGTCGGPISECGEEPEQCGVCTEYAVHAEPEELQPSEWYFIAYRCHSCGYRWTTDARPGR